MRPIPAHLSVAVAGALLGICLHASHVKAQNASVKEIFERHELVGIFAIDCGSQASKTNPYFVNRLLDDAHVQRDRMSGPTTRERVWIIDQARELTADEIYVSGKWDDGQVAESVWRFDGKRVVAAEHSTGGKKEIAGGKWVSNGKGVPWLSKCTEGGNPARATPGSSLGETVTRAVDSGSESVIARASFFNGECGARPVTVTITQPPARGTASIRDGLNTVPERARFGTSGSCAGRQVMGKQIVYRSDPGFRGGDLLVYEFVSDRGERGSTTVVIEVR
jgi:hypothetical protein